MSTSETPMTDGAEYDTGLGDGEPDLVVKSCKARCIERELTAAKADNSKLWHERNAAIEGGWERLKIYIDKHHKEHCQKYITSRDAWKKMAGELLALLEFFTEDNTCFCGEYIGASSPCEYCRLVVAKIAYQKLLKEDA